jgi:hypothetical protein
MQLARSNTVKHAALLVQNATPRMRQYKKLVEATTNGKRPKNAKLFKNNTSQPLVALNGWCQQDAKTAKRQDGKRQDGKTAWELSSGPRLLRQELVKSSQLFHFVFTFGHTSNVLMFAVRAPTTLANTSHRC